MKSKKKLVQGQVAHAQARASAQPTVVVVPIVIQVPVWPVSAEIGPLGPGGPANYGSVLTGLGGC